jgi:hypothetical protein
MTVSLFRTRTLSDTGALDRRLYTSPHSLRITPRIPGPVKPARNSFRGCKLLSAVRLSSSHCTRPHPCTVTAAHLPHTRPLDIPARLAYQRSLVNTYCTSDLCRPRALTRRCAERQQARRTCVWNTRASTPKVFHHITGPNRQVHQVQASRRPSTRPSLLRPP